MRITFIGLCGRNGWTEERASGRNGKRRRMDSGGKRWDERHLEYRRHFHGYVLQPARRFNYVRRRFVSRHDRPLDLQKSDIKSASFVVIALTASLTPDVPDGKNGKLYADGRLRRRVATTCSPPRVLTRVRAEYDARRRDFGRISSFRLTI